MTRRINHSGPSRRIEHSPAACDGRSLRRCGHRSGPRGAPHRGREARVSIVAHAGRIRHRDAAAFFSENMRWADHWVILFPPWHGTMPALFKGFLEHIFRPGFAMEYRKDAFPKRLLSGHSARVVV